MKNKLLPFLCILALSVPLFAHHGAHITYDVSKTIVLKGTVTSFKFTRLPRKFTDAGGVGCTTRNPPGGCAAPATQVEKYHPMSRGSAMNTATRSGLVNAPRASRSRRIGVMNSSQNAAVEDT